MKNKDIARTLRFLSQLMELHEENPFKVKSIANAAFKIDKLPLVIAADKLTELSQVQGLGPSIVAKISELVHSQKLEELENLLKKTPQGILEMLQMKGIGAAKLRVIWKDLGIESIGDLYYACHENRLMKAKGFGLKTQEEIRKAIEFKMAHMGHFLYAQVTNFVEAAIQKIQIDWKHARLVYVGSYRRCCEIMDELQILTSHIFNSESFTQLENIGLEIIKRDAYQLECKNSDGLKIGFIYCPLENFGWKVIEHTGNESHVKALEELLAGKNLLGKSEEEIYQLAGIPFILPELREGTNEIKLAQLHQLPKLIELTDLKGSLHNHSNWSDGVNSLEEMALFCKNELKLTYLGICDHSKSAFYANGLSETRVAAQQQEIDELNVRLAPFHIFKGIESDILFDGSLDYADDILKTFDFVVASIHTVLKMDLEKATARLIKAIENPFTTILGHPTGRLLLNRTGYPVDYKKVIDACAANEVIIEVNANPLRLDLDWRWHAYAIEKGVLLSINPDAHRIAGLRDMYYGILAARKGGVSAANCVNTKSLKEIQVLFQKQHKNQRK